MKILKNLISFLIEVMISLGCVYFVFLKFEHKNFSNYLFFSIPFLVSFLLYFIDKKITGNKNIWIHILSIIFYFLFCLSYLFYAIAHTGFTVL